MDSRRLLGTAETVQTTVRGADFGLRVGEADYTMRDDVRKGNAAGAPTKPPFRKHCSFPVRGCSGVGAPPSGLRDDRESPNIAGDRLNTSGIQRETLSVLREDDDTPKWKSSSRTRAMHQPRTISARMAECGGSVSGVLRSTSEPPTASSDTIWQNSMRRDRFV